MGFNEVMVGLALIVTTVFVTFKLSPVARYYLKDIGLNLFLLLNSFVFVPYGLLNMRDHRRNLLFASGLTHWVNRLFGIRWNVEMACGEGIVGEKASNAYIIVSNHQSVLDVYAMLWIWPQLGHTAFLAKKALLYLGPFGLALRMLGAISIDRAGKEKGRRNVNDAAKRVKQSGANLWVFPEGTRNTQRDGSMLPFKKGAFHMALDTQMPILPIVISEYDFLSPKEKRFDAGTATIKVLEPVSLEGYSKDNIDELIAKVRNNMLAELSTISGKKSN